MSKDKKTINDGYIPVNAQRGYKPVTQPAGDPKPHAGYTPSSSGQNPTNRPPPPGDE